jgi:hypothetical protein
MAMRMQHTVQATLTAATSHFTVRQPIRTADFLHYQRKTVFANIQMTQNCAPITQSAVTKIEIV